ncbi:MAG TPA: GntR family transcriptional regulator [Candidatus Dormibacteraeota bacterium]|nr:GntR family transcriptional regulator [Candidatus Dormibacteraeota bacterium]
MRAPAQVPLALHVATKAEAVYQELRSRILEGSIQPASTLNQEALAATLGLSITPLREALRRLESDGLVRLEAHRTMTIAPLTRRELHELYAVRLQLDPFAAALTAREASDDTLGEIERLARKRIERNPRALLQHNRTFHHAIYSSCRNLVLIGTLDQLWNRTDRYRLIVLQNRIQERAAEEEHREIAAALLGRDARRVADLVHRHVEKTQRLIEQLAKGL